MQKLITIYLDNESCRTQEIKFPDQSHGFVEEHLEDYIFNGWKIKLVTSVGCARASAWIVVLLEKP